MASFTDEDVSNFMDVSMTDARTARVWLQRYHDLQEAAGQFFTTGGVLPPETQLQDRGWDTANDALPFGPLTRDETEGVPIHIDETSSQKHRNTPEIDSWRNNVTSQQGQQTGVVEGSYGWPPQPQERVRADDGRPVVLQNASKDSFLAALITVLHQVPAAREALLARHSLAEEYDRGIGWWNGSPDLDTEEPTERDRFCSEAQRLMAFLDDTERAYGSVATLESVVDSFLQSRRGEEEEDINDLASGFLIMASQYIGPLFRTDIVRGGDGASIPLNFLVLTYDEAIAETGGSILDLMDTDLAVTTNGGGEPGRLERGADVLIFVVPAAPDGKSTGISIPQSFDSGRWFGLDKDSPTMSLRAEKHGLQAILRSTDSMHRALSSVDVEIEADAGKPKHVETRDVSGLLADALSYLAARQAAADTTQSTEPGVLQQLPSALEDAARVVNERRQSIEERRAEALTKIQSTGQLIQEARRAEEGAMSGEARGARYSLRGIVMEPNQFYFQSGIHDPESLLPTTEWQWWRIDATWNHSSFAGWSAQAARSSVTAATLAAKDAKAPVMLIYATEECMEKPWKELPEVLGRFVTADNENFKQELGFLDFKDSHDNHHSGGSSTMADRFSQRDSMDVQMEMDEDGPEPVPPQEGMIRLESHDDDDDEGLKAPQLAAAIKPTPPALPPRQPPVPASAMLAPEPSRTGSKRKNVLSGIKGVLSRSKSRERKQQQQPQQQEDLLVDNDEQATGNIPALSATGSDGGSGPPKKR